MAEIRADERQHLHRNIWQTKPVLREVYAHLYRKIAAVCRPGLTLEVGGGSGNLKGYLPDVLSSDVVSAPWLDFVADAQSLPLKSSSIENIVMFDVLHHIEYPTRFLSEAERVLSDGGRLVMLEPGITPFSAPFYRLLHQEPVTMAIDPLADGRPDPTKDPYVGNQAIPTLLVTREAYRFAQMFPGLKIAQIEWLSLFAYPLSGGFKSWSLLTPALARALLRIEDLVAPILGRLSAFRVLIVVEKTGARL